MDMSDHRPNATNAEPAYPGMRLVQRHHALVGVKVRRRGERWFASRITDISREGFRLTTTARLEAEMPVWIMLPGFEGRGAQVIWVGRHEAGCRFDRPLHAAILDYIVRTSAPFRQGQ